MAKSTRDYIKRHCEQAEVHVDHILHNLMRVAERSQGRNTKINEALPLVVFGIEAVREALKKLREYV